MAEDIGAARDDGSNIITTTISSGSAHIVIKETMLRRGQILPGVVPEGENRRFTQGKDLFKFFVFDYEQAGQCAKDLTWSCGWLAADIPFLKPLGRFPWHVIFPGGQPRSCERRARIPVAKSKPRQVHPGGASGWGDGSS
ncbi:hypothetical protein ABZX90_41570 [Streptomyces sp. NPDC002935]|uniref:hypothetical protein n=1 Tax=Streptomyces sp. NPDC002935 TaxID=3154545 RepID=UPI0033BCAACA